ncbi:hypothetical protein F5Y04DRAFT_130660 [Hypomontagnella monticulosa]|nr:hypothetical protein F5Y04DRAFT_130660 [Hypomontagnella monticulosa]
MANLQMAYIDLPHVFQHALLHSQTYPKNTIHRTIDTYPQSLEKAYCRLSEREWDLFKDDATECEIPIRDLDTACGKGVDKYNIHSHGKLLEWLGISTWTSPENTPMLTGTKKDPKCRFIYIYGIHSRAKLGLTKAMLMDILTFHQVMPAFLDFLYLFGQKSEPTDLQFSSFHEQVVLTSPSDGIALSGLGRSGKYYQSCYNLKSVTLTYENKENITLCEWSIRQAVFHHQFDVVNGNMLWIVVKGNLDIQQRFKSLTDKDARPQDKSFETPEECFRSSLSAHLMYCHWATEDWRWYIEWLEIAIDKEHIMALLGPSEAGYTHKTYTPRDIQDLQIWEEKARKVVMALEGNIDVMSALVGFYRRLAQDKNFPLRKTCSGDINTFATQVGSIIADFRMQIKRTEFLVRTTSDRRQLVIQHLQSQSASRAERLSRSMEKEQAFMLTITVVTLLFLPATFVSTFFSTDIIKYQDPDYSEGKFSKIAMERWAEVTASLTVITFGIAWFFRRRTMRKRKEEDQHDLKTQHTSRKSNKSSWTSSANLLPFHIKELINPKDQSKGTLKCV